MSGAEPKKDLARSILLVSSNAEKKYVLDAIEVIALPRMSVQHFRYQLKWIDPALVAALPTRDAAQNGTVMRGPVMTAYLYQEVNEGKWEWIALYPTRKATLVDAYKTGSQPEDVAHFYFRLEDHFDYGGSPHVEFFKAVLAQVGQGRYYAMYTSAQEPPIVRSQSDESAVNAISSAILKDHLRAHPKTLTQPIPVEAHEDR
jgi:hypothetical protein